MSGPSYSYTDRDGDRVFVSTAVHLEAACIAAPIDGALVPLAELPALIERLREIETCLRDAAEEAGRG